MDYPKEFSDAAQAAVEGEKIEANQEFDNARKLIAPSEQKSEERMATHLRHFVMRVVLAFAKEACKLGHGKTAGTWTWNTARIDQEVHAFVEQVAKETNREKRFYRDGTDFKGDFTLIDTFLGIKVSDAELHRFKASPEWATYQEKLLEVAKLQTTAKGRSTPRTRERRGYRLPVQEWMDRSQIKTLAQAARKLHISKDTLKSIRSEAGRARYSDATLNKVLKEIGYKDDLKNQG